MLLFSSAPALTASLGLLARLGRVPAHPGVPNVTLHHFEQPLDHFDFGERRQWLQRYFTFDTHWVPGGSILFYCGNEANVELYVNATGLMWERAAELGALLVFAEHRYYGESRPLGAASTANASTLRWLTMEQALADYATLIYALKAMAATRHGVAAMSVPVVALGGSYGGMLAAWLRFHYPNAVVGALAASAPVLAFDGIDDPTKPFDGNAYWRVVTADAADAKPGGCVTGCVPGVRAAWKALFSTGASPAGRAQLSRTFRLCGSGLSGAADVTRLAGWLLNVWDTLAMGNFPYAPE
jgi:lysosomal Pro-X carboxypeptidase